MTHARGFTLLELLLVLVLLGISTGIAVVSVDRLATRSAQLQWSDRVQQELRRLRNQAVLGGRPVRAVVDFDGNRITSRDGRALVLPPEYRLRPLPDDTAPSAMPSTALKLMFLPDGNMLEAGFVLEGPAGLQQEFLLEAVSGRIERVQVAAMQ